ncbi:MAG: TlpA family protein disulfide reductase, partial [Anaerolineae bacterium]
MTDQEEQAQVTQRARYSTSWPVGGMPPSSRRSEKSSGAMGLSVNQWVMLVCVGVVLFIGLALATGVVVGRVLRGPMAGRASMAVSAEPAALDARVDPRPEFDVYAGGASLVFDYALASGDEAPGFRLEALDGGTLSLDDLKGRTVLVNFWATWCNWCKYELPALQAVHEKYQDDGLVVVGVDVEEPRALVEAYVQRYGVSFPVVLDVEGATAEAYRVRGLPMTYFVDRNGAIVRVQRGAMREDELELYV